ncbi:hypothetical protein WICMUC_005223 [Wickerhamomyces mucosus]|uniref:SMP-LTD domain-containing protein n=1 Tax=Wickerhamomyces mucosus TaxID=1378264 RepID=A0A9P8P8Q3_9ASCO|nr:hypothetical protein WICMUC_005223 [Wickerhamomyces mucosus]
MYVLTISTIDETPDLMGALHIEDEKELKLEENGEYSCEETPLKLTEIEEKSSSGVNAFKTGWLTVTREYHAFSNNANDKQSEPKSGESKSAYTALYRLVKNSTKRTTSSSSADQVDQEQSSTSSTGNNTGSTTEKTIRRKNRYYGVLRHGNLFLHKDESLKNVQHVIVLSNSIVTLWPRDLKDVELFTKKSAICILKKKSRRKSDIPPKSSPASLSGIATIECTADVIEKGVLPSKTGVFFIYTDTNYEKEDWYFELIKATKKENFTSSNTELDRYEASIYANTLHFKTADMISLIGTLHSSEGQLYTRWFNALLGRIFLGLQGTEFFENVVKDRLVKKLAKINRPGFLEEFKIKKIDVGKAAPFISFPKLQELNPDGSVRVGLLFSYEGKASVQVATKANINLGSHFRTREVNILLAVTLNKLEGPLAIKIKAPPSSRLWYTFEKEPEIDFTIEPVVSQRQITYGMITKAIETRLKEAIKTSLVEPAWDDASFFQTDNEFYRGGIWDTKHRSQEDADSDQAVLEDDELLNEDLDDFDTGIVDEASTRFESIIDANTSHNAGLLNDDVGSIRSRVSNKLNTKSSIENLAIKPKKTGPVIGTSTEQFLANGDYVSKDQQENDDDINSYDGDSVISRNSVPNSLTEENLSNRRTLSNSFKKIGKWYNDKTNTGQQLKSPPAINESKGYKPPDMIQSRKKSSSSLGSTDSNRTGLDSPSSPIQHKTAPQARTFPAEYLFGLETQKPDTEHGTKNLPPTKIPAMQSPYEQQNENLLEANIVSTVSKLPPGEASGKLSSSFPKRKPVTPFHPKSSTTESSEEQSDINTTNFESPIPSKFTELSISSESVESVKEGKSIDTVGSQSITIDAPILSSSESDHKEAVDSTKNSLPGIAPPLPPREIKKLENFE